MGGLSNGPFAPFANLFGRPPRKPPTRWERFRNAIGKLALTAFAIAVIAAVPVGWFTILTYLLCND